MSWNGAVAVLMLESPVATTLNCWGANWERVDGMVNDTLENVPSAFGLGRPHLLDMEPERDPLASPEPLAAHLDCRVAGSAVAVEEQRGRRDVPVGHLARDTSV